MSKTVGERHAQNEQQILPSDLRMHSATTSYCPMEQAVWRSSGTFSSSGPIRASPPSASHTDRLALNWSDSLLASSLSSDILLWKWAWIFHMYSYKRYNLLKLMYIKIRVYFIPLKITNLFSEIIFRYLLSLLLSPSVSSTQINVISYSYSYVYNIVMMLKSYY